ncbi:MAG: DUF2147 domain-containing protein [Bacteroidales bacterium]|nr:DUF2147 domain-containing protein [Bacteroidales bacterium]
MKIKLFALTALFFSLSLMAQNNNADSIIGIYQNGSGKDAYKVQISKKADGSFKGAVCWMAEVKDANGKMKTDVKNPDKALRNVPLDKVVIFDGLKYDPVKKQWSDAKIYDPDRGIRVKMTAKFEGAKTLVVRGTVLGIGESVSWTKE